MRPQSPKSLVIAICLVLGGAIAGGACKGKKTSQPTAGPTPPASDGPAVPPPAELLAQVSLGPLPRWLPRLTVFGTRLALWPELPPEGLWQELRAVAMAASDLGPLTDWSRPAHLLVLDPKKYGLGAMVFLLPMKDPTAALARLAKRCDGGKQPQGDRWQFTGGGQALLPCSFAALPLSQGVMVSATPAALEAARPYVEGSWRASPSLRHDVELRLFPAAVLQKVGLPLPALQRAGLGLSAALGMVLPDPRLAGPLGDALQALIKYLGGTEYAGLGVRVDLDRLTVRAFARATPGGSLDRWIDGTHPTRLPALGKLEPAIAALALPGKAAADGQGKAHDSRPGVALAALLALLPEPGRSALLRVATPLLLAPPDNAVVALRTCTGGGLCLTARMRHPKAQLLARHLHASVADANTFLLHGDPTKPGKSRTGKAKPKPAPLPPASPDGLHRGVLDMSAPWPAKLVDAQMALLNLAGTLKLPVVVGSRGNLLALAAGPSAEAEVKRLLDQGPLAPSRVKGTPEADRTGLASLRFEALADLLGLPADSRAKAGAKSQAPSPALVLHWGLDRQRRRVNLTLELPVAQFHFLDGVLGHLVNALGLSRLGGLLTGAGTEPEDAL